MRSLFIVLFMLSSGFSGVDARSIEYTVDESYSSTQADLWVTNEFSYFLSQISHYLPIVIILCISVLLALSLIFVEIIERSCPVKRSPSAPTLPSRPSSVANETRSVSPVPAPTTRHFPSTPKFYKFYSNQTFNEQCVTRCSTFLGGQVNVGFVEEESKMMVTEKLYTSFRDMC